MGIDDTILSLQPGDHLGGRYELARILGRGGMGVVWLAHDHRLNGRAVALKVLPAALSTEKRAVARLKEEANRNLELTHPHIVRLYTFDQDPTRQDVAFLVMQYIEGQTLNDLLADHPKGMPVEMIRPWFEQVAQAIDYAHEQGILHRDIKPGNIIIEAKTNAAYLVDFGIGREARDTMTRMTGVQDSSGTLPYMSPQQLMGKNDKSNDVYSFAATLYEALCGHPPFHTGDIAYQIRHAKPEAIGRVSAPVNESLCRGLAKDTTARPPTCGALLQSRRQRMPNAVHAEQPAIRTGRGEQPRHLDRRVFKIVPGADMVFIYIDAPSIAPKGFLVGSPEGELLRGHDEHQFRAVLSRGYWMQATQVTQYQWQAMTGVNPSSFRISPTHPVDSVGWLDCRKFVAQLRVLGFAARLPTEAEWEFACRSGTVGPFNTGDTISADQANFDGRHPYGQGSTGVYRGTTTPVASFQPNAWGLYDMHGNVYEWCGHAYRDYPSGIVRDPFTKWKGTDGVLRGGSWSTVARNVRSACRYRAGVHVRDIGNTMGFRLALDSE